MDDRGHWHNVSEKEVAQRNAMRDMDHDRNESGRSNDRPRFVFSMEIGSTVELVRGDDKVLAVFEGAEKNKVTLRPIEQAGVQMPYLEVAETVTLSNGSDDGVKAQVWDTRKGRIILRTLPV